MTDRLILCLPEEAALAAAENLSAVPPLFWARLSGARVIATGSGKGWRAAEQGAAHGNKDADILFPVVLLAPAADAVVRFMQYENAPPAQAAAAARIDVLKHILGDRTQAHIVAAPPPATGQAFPVAVTRHSAMKAWAGWLAANGISASGIIPAALILPPPAPAGLVAVALGDQHIMRSALHGYASDPALNALMAPGADIRWIDAEERDRALAFAGQTMPCNLLSGAWKIRQGWQGDAELLLWIRRLVAGLILISLAVAAVQGLRLKQDSARADKAVLDAAQSLGINAGDAAAAEAVMDRMLAEKGGGPLAFSVPASALYAALAETPAISLKNLSHRGDGTLSATIAGPRVEDVNAVLIALQARGYRITAQPMAGTDGQQMAILTIRAVP